VDIGGEEEGIPLKYDVESLRGEGRRELVVDVSREGVRRGDAGALEVVPIFTWLIHDEVASNGSLQARFE